MDYYEECRDIVGDISYGTPEFEKRLDLIEEYLYAKFLAREIVLREDVEAAREVARERAKFGRDKIDFIVNPNIPNCDELF